MALLYWLMIVVSFEIGFVCIKNSFLKSGLFDFMDYQLSVQEYFRNGFVWGGAAFLAQ
jgi:hypothetical protein